jgi:serine/threonine protein kinase
MVPTPVERDLRFGVLAVEMGFIDRTVLIEGLHHWGLDPSRTLSEVLVTRDCLTSEESTEIDGFVDRTLGWDSAWVNDRDALYATSGNRTPLPVREKEPRFKVIRAHAKGGLGEISLALDSELGRRVALKEIRAKHQLNPVSRGRFVAEAEITGRLEHPGIVPVYGLGMHPDGRPYYAMRFIKGEDLATAIRRFHAGGAHDYSGLEFRWLLRKLIEVCNTVAYAHSRGVLHRDLKPANVMIGPFGETLVMDWGVAKVLGAEGALGDAERAEIADPDGLIYRGGAADGAVTLTGQALGTPTYMSPEQAAGDHDNLGPASDVYSLGATLYVLLTNQRPFQGKAKDVLPLVQAGRFQPPLDVEPRVPGALDAICRRAMALAPGDRYPSALDLASDIERWLADEPTSVWPEPRHDRARRWIRRHQAQVTGVAAALAVALLALIVAVPLLSLAWRNELSARQSEQFQRFVALGRAREAQANESLASEERDRAQKALGFLVDAFRRPDPLRDGRTVKVIDLLANAVNELDQAFRDEPLMKATLLTAIGETYSGLGMNTEAFAAFEGALRLRREVLGDDHPSTLGSMNSVAMAHYDAGSLDRAVSMLEVTLQKRRSTLGDGHPDTIETSNDLAVAYWKIGQAKQAIPLYESTLSKVRVSLGEDHTDTLTIMDNLGVAYAEAGQHQDAIRLHEKAMAQFAAKLGPDHLTTLVTKNNLARALQGAGRVSESIAIYKQAITGLQIKLTDEHPTTLAARNGLAMSYRLAGEIGQSIAVFESVLAGRRTKLGPNHPETLQTTLDLATAYREAGQATKAVALARAFLDGTAALGGRVPANLEPLLVRAHDLVRSGDVSDSAPATSRRPAPDQGAVKH